MGRRTQAGMTLVELSVMLGALALVALVTYPAVRSELESAKATSMKGQTRGIWCSIISANAEREPLGLSSLWPSDLGYNFKRTSTEYFRQLMSDSNGVISVAEGSRVCFDLKPYMLGGAGVPRMESVLAFTCTNNAWVVLCISSNTDSAAPFLVTRNVDWGKVASTSTPVTLTRERPFRDRRVVWGTCGGGCFDSRLKLDPSCLSDSLGTNTLDVMRP